MYRIILYVSKTLVNAERYIVPELKDFENKILSAKEKIEQLEYYIFTQLREKIRLRLFKCRKLLVLWPILMF